MKSLVLLAAVGLVFLGVGCTMPASAVYGGLFMSNVKGPVGGVDNAVKATKAGRATATGIMGVAMGDASINAAMRQASITKVHHIDCESFGVMGVYGTFTTVVHGE